MSGSLKLTNCSLSSVKSECVLDSAAMRQPATVAARSENGSVVSKGRPHSIEVVEERGERFVVATYADGSVLRKPVDPNERPRRKPRKTIARARTESLDKTRRKQIRALLGNDLRQPKMPITKRV